MRVLQRPHIDCSVDGCTNNTKAQGMCNNHYQQLRRRGHVITRHRHCGIDGCTNRYHARGYCTSHYQNWKRTGNPLALAVQQIPRKHVVYLCRLVGLPDDGPTAEMVARWRTEEAAEELETAA